MKEQTRPEVRRIKEIIKITAEINEIEDTNRKIKTQWRLTKLRIGSLKRKVELTNFRQTNNKKRQHINKMIN